MATIETVIGIIALVILTLIFVWLCKKWGKKFFYITLVGIGIGMLSGDFGSFLVFVGIVSYIRFVHSAPVRQTTSGYK